MKSKLIFFLIASVLTTTIYSQSVLDEYKYVMVQKQFHFQAEPNQYDLNRIVKYLFEDQGFQVVVEGQSIPKDLRSDFCLALNSDVRISGMLRTKATVILRNCEGKIVYQTEEGVTKEKEHKRAYNIAIHKAFESFNSINYKYQPKEDEDGNTDTKIAEETAEKEMTKEIVVEDQPAKEAVETKQDVDQTAEEVVKQDTSTENATGKQAVAEAVIAAKEEAKESAKYQSDARQLFARKMDNGYDITHNSKTVMTIIETSIKDVYLVKGQDGLVYKEDGKWLYLDKSKASNKPVLLNLKFFP